MSGAIDQNSRAVAYLIPQIERLLQLPLETEADLNAWYLAWDGISVTLEKEFPDFETSENFHHFVSDADIRLRDKDYKDAQEKWVVEYLEALRASTTSKVR